MKVYKPRYGYYLTTAPHPRMKGKIVAVISDGHIQRGQDTKVLDIAVVETVEQARAWYKKAIATESWVKAN